MREEKQYPMSSESECSCRVEGSGSQCKVLIQPDHRSVLVRERRDRQGRRGSREDGTKTVSHTTDAGHREWRVKTECVLIEKRAGAKAKETFWNVHS